MDSLLLPCHAVLYPLSRTVSDWVTQWGDLKEHQWSPCRSNEKSPPVGLWPVTKIGGDLFFFFFIERSHGSNVAFLFLILLAGV